MPRLRLFSSLKEDHWVKPFLKQYRPTLILAVFLGLLMFFCASALMFTSGYLITHAAEMPGNIMLIYVPIVLTRAFGIGRPVFRYAERLTSHNWVLKMTSKLRLKLYETLEKDAIFFRSLHKTGDILGLLAHDIGHIQNLYLRTIFPTLVAWGVYLLFVIVLGYFSWWFALVMLLLLGVVVFLVPLVSVLYSSGLQARRKHLKNELYSELTDNVLGISDWIISNRSKDYLDGHRATQKALKEIQDRLDDRSQLRALVLQCLFGLIVVALLLWSGSYFGVEGNGMVVWIAAFVLCFFPLIDAFVPLGDAALETNVYADSIDRLNDLSTTETADRIVSYEPKSSEAPGEASAPASLEVSLDAPFVLCVKDLSFQYPSSKTILDDINITIPSGQKLALLGRSGSGKSTLAMLLRGDLLPSKGTVTLNGIPTSHFGDAIARYVGVIQQQTYLFNTSLRNNLKLGNQALSDDAIWDVLEKVDLSPLVEKLPNKLDTIVDEAGLRFSGGERHRIALARVLLQDVPIIILDEPTVSLDLVTEKALLETLFRTVQDKTLIMITHHLLGVSLMDHVVFIEDGSIALEGSPSQLANESPYYQQLLRFDQGGFL